MRYWVDSLPGNAWTGDMIGLLDPFHNSIHKLPAHETRTKRPPAHHTCTMHNAHVGISYYHQPPCITALPWPPHFFIPPLLISRPGSRLRYLPMLCGNFSTLAVRLGASIYRPVGHLVQQQETPGDVLSLPQGTYFCLKASQNDEYISNQKKEASKQC